MLGGSTEAVQWGCSGGSNLGRALQELSGGGSGLCGMLLGRGDALVAPCLGTCNARWGGITLCSVCVCVCARGGVTKNASAHALSRGGGLGPSGGVARGEIIMTCRVHKNAAALNTPVYTYYPTVKIHSKCEGTHSKNEFQRQPPLLQMQTKCEGDPPNCEKMHAKCSRPYCTSVKMQTK